MAKIPKEDKVFMQLKVSKIKNLLAAIPSEYPRLNCKLRNRMFTFSGIGNCPPQYMLGRRPLETTNLFWCICWDKNIDSAK